MKRIEAEKKICMACVLLYQASYHVALYSCEVLQKGQKVVMMCLLVVIVEFAESHSIAMHAGGQPVLPCDYGSCIPAAEGTFIFALIPSEFNCCPCRYQW